MTFITGLKDINKLIEGKINQDTGSKIRWFKLEDGQSAKIRFMNELDADSKFYDESRGLAIVVKEHTNPKDYRKKAIDTMESEGRDWAEEQHRKDPKAGWKGRFRFYINAILDNSIDDPYVVVWSMGVAKSPTFDIIREYAMETEGITNMSWRVKRNGRGTETSYLLIPGERDREPFDWSSYKAYPLEMAVNKIPYVDQESYYLGYDNPLTSPNAEW